MRKLGFGLMRLPLVREDDPRSIDQEQVNEMVAHFMEKGFTYFDTAYPYHGGMSEIAVRKAVVERYPRDAYQLADKMPVWMVAATEDYQRLFDEQLERCGVAYFDYYLLHTLGEKNYADTLQFGGFSFMQKLKEEGKVKHIGFSYHDNAAILDRILTEHPEMEFVQLQINYIDWESDSIQARQCYEVATRHGKPVIVMEPVKGGSLARVPNKAEELFTACRPDWSPASWAIRFAASLENVFMVLSGMSNLQQLVDNAESLQSPAALNEQEHILITKAAEIINASIAVPCTACRYCVEECPQNIPIPQYLSLYNDQHLFGLSPLHQNYYMNLGQANGKASDCIACKCCEQHCPQRIAIADQMKLISDVFES